MPEEGKNAAKGEFQTAKQFIELNSGQWCISAFIHEEKISIIIRYSYFHAIFVPCVFRTESV
jgi:hypothetical protein